MPSREAQAISTVVGHRLDEAHRLLGRSDLTEREAREKARGVAASAIFSLFQALAPALTDLETAGQSDVRGQVLLLNYLAEAGVFPTVLGPLAVSLHFAGRHANADGPEAVYWQAVTVQLFEVMRSRFDLTVEDALDKIESRPNPHPRAATLQDWRGKMAEMPFDARPVRPEFAIAGSTVEGMVEMIADAATRANKARSAQKKVASGKTRKQPKTGG